MNFNFFKSTLYKKLINRFLYRFTSIFVYILRKTEYYSLFAVYWYRTININTNIVDIRFYKANPLFDKCSNIICKDSFNNEIIISKNKYENLRNIGYYSSIGEININDIKNMCLVPKNVDLIEFHLFPWEIVDKDYFVITTNIPFKL